MKKNPTDVPAYKWFWIGIISGLFFAFLLVVLLGLFLYLQESTFGLNDMSEKDLLSLANRCFNDKKYIKSKLIYEKVLEKNPNSYDANLYLGSLYSGYLEPHDYKKGIQYLQKAVSQKKDDENLFFLARDLWEDGQFSESEKVIRKYANLENFKNKASTWENLGYVLKMQSKFNESLKAYKKAMALDPENQSIQNEINSLKYSTTP